MAEKSRNSYAAEELRRHDNDRYLCTLFAPADKREDLFALYAFNLEVARTREAVSESMIGQIRLQWWREAIEGIYAGQPRKHAVVEALNGAVQRHDLPRAPFDALIDARELDLEDQGPRDMAELIAYAEATSSGLISLALDALAIRDEAAREAAREAAAHVGVAWSLAGLLRALPFHARGKRIYLPQERVAAADMDLADYFELRPSPAIAAVVREVAGEAAARLARARALRTEVPRAALSALLPATLADRSLRRLHRVDYDPFAERLAADGVGRALTVALAVARGRY